MTRRKVTKTQAEKIEEENPEQNEEMEDTEEDKTQAEKIEEENRGQNEEIEDTEEDKKPKIAAEKIEGKGKTASKKGGGQRKRGGGGTWDDRIKECKEYIKKHGNCKIPTAYKENKALGIWVQETRRNFKMMNEGKKPRKSLSPEQIEELKSIGFDWGKYKPDPLKMFEGDAAWESNFNKLREYKDANGDFDVPMDVDEPYKPLAKWVRLQRHQNFLREGKRKSTLTKERVKKLKDIGFDWYGSRKIEF